MASLSSAVIAPSALSSRGRHRRLVARAGDDHAAEPRFEVVDVVGETEDRHHLGGDGDVEAVSRAESRWRAAESDDDLSQGAVVHVERPPPGDPARVEPSALPQ